MAKLLLHAKLSRAQATVADIKWPAKDDYYRILEQLKDVATNKDPNVQKQGIWFDRVKYFTVPGRAPKETSVGDDRSLPVRAAEMRSEIDSDTMIATTTPQEYRFRSSDADKPRNPGYRR